jgi:hypothetical protein
MVCGGVTAPKPVNNSATDTDTATPAANPGIATRSGVTGAGNATIFGVAPIVPVPARGIPARLPMALALYRIALQRRRLQRTD